MSVPPERRRLNRLRWQSLPSAARAPQQALGRSFNACGATHGLMEACDLSCTSCYLPQRATTWRRLDRGRVSAQLAELRRLLGPKGKCQITDGEVTLLPRRELGGIVERALELDLDPMLMTNGRRLLAEPDLLPELVATWGLGKIAIHVDTTQIGRPDAPEAGDERAFNQLRERFAQLIRRTRSKTGRTLHAAHTVTVTEHNLDQVESIVSWTLANRDAFRMLSLQPSAEVGRTVDQGCDELTMDAVWMRVCRAMGRPLNPRAMLFGHPECTLLAPLLIVECGSQLEIFEIGERDHEWDREFLGRFLATWGGFTTTGRSRWKSLVGALGLAARHPTVLGEGILWTLARIWRSRRPLAGVIGQLLRFRHFRVHPFAIVIHAFMSPAELASDGGRERLAACAFKTVVDGTAISMCEMNAGGVRAGLGGPLRSPRANPSGE